MPVITQMQRLPENFVAQPHLDHSCIEGQVGLAYDDATIPYTVGIVAEWPASVTYIGDGANVRRTYYRTGKLGSWADDDPLADANDPDCTPCAEYQCGEEGSDRRVWLLLSGELTGAQLIA